MYSTDPNKNGLFITLRTGWIINNELVITLCAGWILNDGLFITLCTGRILKKLTIYYTLYRMDPQKTGYLT